MAEIIAEQRSQEGNAVDRDLHACEGYLELVADVLLPQLLGLEKRLLLGGRSSSRC